MKRAIVWLYTHGLLPFQIADGIARRLRKYRWFREG